MSDLRLAFRQLARSPGFAVTAVLTFALGIAGNVIIFSLINAYLLRPLPYEDPERLVHLDETAPRWNLEFTSVNYLDFEDWHSQNQTFASMGVWRTSSANLSNDERAERVTSWQVSHDLAATLRLQPAAGRLFYASDEVSGAARVVVVGHHLWQEMFEGSDEAIGQTVLLDSEPHTVIGVLPPEVLFPDRPDVWVPLVQKPEGWGLHGVGRLREGVSIAQAQADLRRIHRAHGAMESGKQITAPVVQRWRDRLLGDAHLGAFTLQGSVVVVLLIACANIAGLMLARSFARSGEFGVRAALGGSRWRIARQITTEGLVLVLLGAVLGTFLGLWGLDLVIATQLEAVPPWLVVELDMRFLLFMVALCAGATLIAGWMPARQVTQGLDVRSVLSAGSTQTTSSRQRLRVLRTLVVTEIALAMLLLITAGLLAQAFRQLRGVDPGFRADNLITYDLALPATKYAGHESRVAFFREHMERIRMLPGVVAASACTTPPLSGHWGNHFIAQGTAPRGSGESQPIVLQRFALTGYFETMGIALVEGRTFREDDNRDHPVVIVNEALARHFWPGQNPLGRRLRMAHEGAPWMEVIGVAREVKHYGVETETGPGVYIPYSQYPHNSMVVVVRTAGEPALLAPLIRAALREQDPALAMAGLTTMNDRLRDSMRFRHFYSVAMIVSAVAALLTATAGIYGVIAFVVNRRVREIGIRVALGAQAGDILRLILREGLVLAAIGVPIGAMGSVLVGRLTRSLLAGVNPISPVVHLSLTSLLLVIVGAACLLPARRATRINPVDVLRDE